LSRESKNFYMKEDEELIRYRVHAGSKFKSLESLLSELNSQHDEPVYYIMNWKNEMMIRCSKCHTFKI